MPMEPNSLTTGTEVWMFRVENWAHKVFERPQIYHGVVSGGGEVQVIIQWDGSRNVDRENRRRKAEQLYATEREAVAAALAALVEIEATAISRTALAGTAAFYAQLRLDKLDNKE